VLLMQAELRVSAFATMVNHSHPLLGITGVFGRATRPKTGDYSASKPIMSAYRTIR